MNRFISHIINIIHIMISNGGAHEARLGGRAPELRGAAAGRP